MANKFLCECDVETDLSCRSVTQPPHHEHFKCVNPEPVVQLCISEFVSTVQCGCIDKRPVPQPANPCDYRTDQSGRLIWSLVILSLAILLIHKCYCIETYLSIRRPVPFTGLFYAILLMSGSPVLYNMLVAHTAFRFPTHCLIHLFTITTVVLHRHLPLKSMNFMLISCISQNSMVFC